ncbi:glycosyltransferase [Marinobacter daepoensis]|uniref:Glycosyltransferase n=1 Tax=Marinobacter daepoensis TaxID=262077 RepID=A0ABS3BHI7_9GAMM|nr:glycosyltransferase [Marinobacter daepoensis]MBY6079155.1 glycosyltransferase [Marinobacter daepoensis]
MSVSIITVSFNSEATIRGTLESVRNQNYENIEHVVVDGASKDQTISIVNEYREGLGTVISEPDQGLYDAMNKGVSASTGDIIGILNSDDFFESDDVIAAVVKVFENHPEIDVVFGDVVFVEPKNLEKITRYYRSGHFRPWKLRFGWMPAHPATFVRTSAYKRVGMYRQDMRISADYEMFVRWLLVEKLRYEYLPRVLVRMRSGGVSTSGVKSSIRLNREIVRACRDNGVYTNILFVLSKIPFKLMELLRRPK